MFNNDLQKFREDKRKYLIYSRKSKFTGKGESVENQIEICKKYIRDLFEADVKEEDIIIKQDEGFSGKDVKRPQYKEMMKLIEDKQIKMVICYRLDRISRNTLDFGEFYEILTNNDIRFVSCSERFDDTTPTGRLMLNMSISFAQFERETIAERIRDNMMELAKTGRWLGGNTPMGFVSEKIEKLNINDKKVSLYKLSPVSDEIDIIKLIYSKYLELKSLTTLETFLLNNNLKTRKNVDFARWGLKKILTNPVYATADEDTLKYFKSLNMEIYNEDSDWDGTHGVMSYNKTMKTKTGSVKEKDKELWVNAIGKHKGIIKGKDWVEVQELLNNNTNKSYRKPVKNNSILAGILRCEHCGNLMRPKLKDTTLPNGDRKFNYICDLKMRSRGKQCSCPNVNGNEADKLVIEGIKQLAQPTSEFYNELLKVIKDNDYGKTSQTNEIEVLERKKNETSTSIKNLISRLEVVDDELFDDLQNKIKDLKRKEKDIITKLQELKASRPDSYTDQETAKTLLYILDNYMNKFESLDLLSQRNFLKLFIGSCTTDGTDIHMDLIGSRNHTTTYQPCFEDSESSETGTHGGQIVLSSESCECNVHIKELYFRTNDLFERISRNIKHSFTLKTHTCWNLTPITPLSTLGEQIRYYRRLNDIKQTDLGLKLNFERSTLNHLENRDMKLVNVDLIKGIIKELDIEDKININDDYIKFLLDNPCEKIRKLRKKKKMTLQQFGELLGVSDTSVRRWEHGNQKISRSKYERLKRYL